MIFRTLWKGARCALASVFLGAILLYAQACASEQTPVAITDHNQAVPDPLSEPGTPSPLSTPTPGLPTSTPSPLPPPAGRIAFVSDQHGSSDVGMMQADGTHATTLLRTDSQEEESPSWSPDGLHLVFSSLSAGNNPHIYRMEVERPAPVRLTDIPPDEDALFPAWSPDGKRIAFVSSHAEGADIYVMQADGSNPTRLTDNGANNMFPAWSPDGKFLLFTSDQAGTTEVYVMGADGSNPIRLSSSGGITAFPAWSPDGNTIAYMSNMDIYLMNRDGSNQRELVSNDTWVWGITWSPDSTYLAFAAMKGDNYDIYMHALDGSVQVNLTESAANEMFPSWAP